ncbi:Ail/Lom family outer membrane beta-barrel protein [Escherichia coli]|nr:Ail/Lom family outer membrane beta-barrel protein [Escherichia coli]
MSPTWNAGIQFSPVETVVIDLAYEGRGGEAPHLCHYFSPGCR